MAKKRLKLFGIGLLCACMFFGGCGAQGIPALKGGPEASAAVESQRGSVVKKGDFLYYVNGAYDSTVSSEFGSADKHQRGYIYRAELDASGAVKADSVQILCPKQVYTAAADAGLFLVGDRIYFGAVTTHRDRRDELLTNYLDLYSVKIDGTDCREIAVLTSNSFTSRWEEKEGKVYFVYIDSTDSTAKSIEANGTRRTIAEKYVGTPILGDDGYVYYNKRVEKPDQEGVDEDELRYESYYETYRAPIDGGEEELVLAADSEAVNKTYAVTLTRVENNALYYTVTRDSNTLVYAYELTSGKLVQISANALTTVHKYLGFDGEGNYRGVLATFQNQFMFIKPEGTGFLQTNLLENVSLPSTVLTVDGEYLYYTDGSNVLRVQIGSESGWKSRSEAETIFRGAINTTTYAPEIVGESLYFMPTSTTHPTYASYPYRLKKDRVIPKDTEDEDVEAPEAIGKLTEADQEIYDEAQKKIDKENEKNQEA